MNFEVSYVLKYLYVLKHLLFHKTVRLLKNVMEIRET